MKIICVADGFIMSDMRYTTCYPVGWGEGTILTTTIGRAEILKILDDKSEMETILKPKTYAANQIFFVVQTIVKFRCPLKIFELLDWCN
jgi:hypothetical protein